MMSSAAVVLTVLLLVIDVTESMKRNHHRDKSKTVSIFQIWQQKTGDGNDNLPLHLIRKDCNDGELVSLRLKLNFLEGSSLVHSEVCSAISAAALTDRNKKKLLKVLTKDVKACYSRADCAEVDLSMYWSGLVNAECQFCHDEEGCQRSSTDVLKQKAFISMEVGCKATVSESGNFIQLQTADQSSIIVRKDQLTSNCQGEDKPYITGITTHNGCAKSLEPTASELEMQRESLRQVQECVLDDNCAQVTVRLSAGVCTDHRGDDGASAVIFWRCASPDEFTGSDDGQSLVVAVVLLAILLIISLVFNGILFYCWRRMRKEVQCMGSIAKNNNVQALDNAIAARATLKKYEQTLEHGLSDHRYASLRPQNSDEKYEYIDTTAQVSHDPKLDSLGYLVPDPVPNVMPAPRRTKPPPILTRRPHVDEEQKQNIANQMNAAK